MGKRVAVVAHFDADNILDDNFLRVLECLVSVVDYVVLVSTSDVPEHQVSYLDKVVLIKRPNIGYDFYSYRVGLAFAEKSLEIEKVLFTNSSYFITNTKLYKKTVELLLSGASHGDAVSLTESNQFGRHLQSYMMVVDSALLRQTWVKDFFKKIEPTNSKFEIILNYEIGFSKAMAAHKVDFASIYRPSLSVSVTALLKWARIIGSSTPAISWFSRARLSDLRSVNWTHFAAVDIAKRFGIVKSEVMRTNPHNINTDSIIVECDDKVRGTISASINRSRQYYVVAHDGLSKFSLVNNSLPSYRAVTYGSPRVPGVRVAVVIHLYYYDLLDEIKQYLRNIIEPFDLYVTTPFEGDVSKIINDTASLAASVTVHVSENRGRDIGPFMALYLSGGLDQYTAVLKLHSKKSKYSTLGSEWRKSIYGALMGDSFIVRKVLSQFATSPVGIIGPHNYYLSNEKFWGANYDTYRHLLIASGSGTTDYLPPLGFFAGSMFWFAPSAFTNLKKIPQSELDFPAENGMQDGTLAHALERVFCPVARSQGYITTSVLLAGAEINDTETLDNRVPVL